jgi:hypothetical protein
VIPFCTGCNHAVKVSEEPVISSEVTPDYTEDNLAPADYNHWFTKEAEHLRKSAVNENLKFELLYLSPEYSALLELQGDKPSAEKWDTLIKNHSETAEFKLMISGNNFNDEFIKMDKPNHEVYEERIKYYAFEMQKDIYGITNDQDTIPCSMYHFERAYGISPVSTFLIGFSDVDWKDDLKIIIKEKVFSKNALEFKFRSEEIKNVPQLKPF